MHFRGGGAKCGSEFERERVGIFGIPFAKVLVQIDHHQQQQQTCDDDEPREKERKKKKSFDMS